MGLQSVHIEIQLTRVGSALVGEPLKVCRAKSSKRVRVWIRWASGLGGKIDVEYLAANALSVGTFPLQHLCETRRECIEHREHACFRLIGFQSPLRKFVRVGMLSFRSALISPEAKDGLPVNVRVALLGSPVVFAARSWFGFQSAGCRVRPRRRRLRSEIRCAASLGKPKGECSAEAATHNQ